MSDSAAAQRDRSVVVVIGAGGMGVAIARRQGAGRRLVLADFDEVALQRAGTDLRGEGFDVATHVVDVSSRASVAALATAASMDGRVAEVIHTAGLSPVQAPVAAIVAVDLLGVALVLEEFGAVISPGGAAVVISSMAAYGAALDPQIEQQLAVVAPEELRELPIVSGLTDRGAAYSVSKRGNQLRVQAASTRWGARGARVNSVSPGVIATAMGQRELDGEHGDIMRAMIAGSGTGRVGTAADIADAVAFLLGPAASFITGTDLLVDGGVIAMQRAS
ncbi:SDR family oxidoreductase [Nocardia sp. NPDC050712]|uniref:SDR family oxidoreductase n=1 Tax=Nocardia sp. NPDC050712 TaxID=3155518 RepID=UPI0033EF65F7